MFVDTIKQLINPKQNHGKWGTYQDSHGLKYDEITYTDGTKIRFLGKVAEAITPDGKTLKYYGHDRAGYEMEVHEQFATYQGSKVKIEESEGFRFICQEIIAETNENYRYDSEAKTMDLLKEISNLHKNPWTDDESALYFEAFTSFENSIPDEEIGENTDLIYDIEEQAVFFEETCKSNHFNTDFLTYKYISEEHLEDLNKKIIENNSWKTEWSGYEDERPGRCITGQWLVITLREKDNPANCGIETTPHLIQTPGYYDCQFITAPGQKYERQIVDKDNKIIIQKPIL